MWGRAVATVRRYLPARLVTTILTSQAVIFVAVTTVFLALWAVEPPPGCPFGQQQCRTGRASLQFLLYGALAAGTVTALHLEATLLVTRYRYWVAMLEKLDTIQPHPRRQPTR